MQTNYDLSITYTSHMGRCNSKIYYALDYLRFLEQTGHPFRIQMVTNTKGFQRVIETLYLYYPQWCLIQILIAQNEKELDMLFGRNKLSGMTQEEVDNCIQEYIKALDLVSKNIKPENANWSTSVYDNSAKILPQIISRLCYKCSIEILDQILDYMLILCSSNVRDNFKGINKILEGVCNAYTEKEQGERIEKILRFPMKTNERRTYYDPVNYLKRPKEKYKINDDLYNNIIIQIRQLMEIGTAQEKADALQRLIILAQLIYLKQNDEEYLYQCLEKKQTCEHQNILYHLNKERYKLNDDLILKSTLQLMEQDSNKQYFSSHTGSYRELIDILPDVQSDAIDYKKIFSVMTKLIKTNIDRKNDQQTAFQIEERSKQSYRIAVGLLLLKIKKKEIISIEEKEVIEEYFKTLQEYYNASNVLEFIEKLLLEKLNISEDIYTNMEEKLWLHSEEDINLLQIFYLETSRIKIDIKQMKRFGTFSNMVYQMAIYRIINTEISNVMPVLRLLYNRFRQVWCPGSTFKPVVAGIGLKTGSIDPKEDFGNEGLAWQKDSSWGSYQVTTLHEYEPVIMKNAIIYSDNIYFAKAALKIGSENFMNTLNEIGFNQNMPFEIAMQESTYSNTDKIETEIQLADSGYGQGQILVNPLHLASIYTSFLNEGNMIKPYLKYKEEASGETWIENAFSKENVEEIMQGVEGVVNDPEGTGYAAHRDDILLAGKTGTAELKATKEDTSGKEIGWFSVFTADKSVDKPILLISMVENVKGIGGSGYVVKKDATVLEEYFEK